ncbi:MAG: hypothetical protein ACRC8Y_04835 [Chroococcales cyanobacterium]
MREMEVPVCSNDLLSLPRGVSVSLRHAPLDALPPVSKQALQPPIERVTAEAVTREQRLKSLLRTFALSSPSTVLIFL